MKSEQHRSTQPRQVRGGDWAPISKREAGEIAQAVAAYTHRDGIPSTHRRNHRNSKQKGTK